MYVHTGMYKLGLIGYICSSMQNVIWTVRVYTCSYVYLPPLTLSFVVLSN